MIQVLQLMLFLLAFAGWSLAYARHSKLPLGYFPFLFVSSVICLSYTMGYLCVLPIAPVLIYLGGVSLLARVRKREVNLLLRSPSWIAFVAMATLAWFVVRGFSFLHVDEFSYWGWAAKETLLRHAMRPADTLQMFAEYPPGTALFAYFIQLPGLRHHEGMVYWANALLILAPLVVLLVRLRWRNWFRVGVLLVLGLFAVELLGTGFENLQVDQVLAVFFSGALLVGVLVLNTDRQRLYLGPVLVALCLLKQSGLVFALMACGVVLLNSSVGAYLKKRAGRQFPVRPQMALGATLLIACIVVCLSWSLRLRFIDTSPTPARVAVNATNLAQVVRNPSELEHEVRRRFGEAFFTRSVTRVVTKSIFGRLTGVDLKFNVASVHVCAALLSFVLLFAVTSAGWLRVRLVVLAGALIASYLIYQGLLFVLMSMVFGKSEALGLASYERYLIPCHLGFIVAAIGLLNPKIARLRRARLALAAVGFGALFVFVCCTPIFPVFTRSVQKSTQLKKRVVLKKYADVVSGQTDPSSSVYIIFQQSWGFEYHVLTYELTPRRTNCLRSHLPWHYSITSNGDEDHTYPLTQEQWSDRLRERYDYVMIPWRTESFVRDYAALFENRDEAMKHLLYKVDKNRQGLVRLRPCR